MQRKASRASLTLGLPGSTCLGVVDFAVALQKEGTDEARALLANYLCWLSKHLEDVIPLRSSSDPLDAPVFQGHLR
eukprot:10276171-Lingulodinium_polyedra.AAC.1